MPHSAGDRLNPCVIFDERDNLSGVLAPVTRFLAVSHFMLAGAGFAQTTGSIAGIVTGPDGAAVATAAVHAKNVATSIR